MAGWRRSLVGGEMKASGAIVSGQNQVCLVVQAAQTPDIASRHRGHHARQQL